MADEIVLATENPAELAKVELAQARAKLAWAARGLKSDLQWIKLPQRMTTSIEKYPLLWVGGAFALGAVLGSLSRRKNGSE